MLQTTVKDTTKTEYIAIYCRTATYDCVSIENQKARLIQAAFDRGYAIEQILPSAENRNDTVAVIIESVPIAAPCTTSERWFWRN